jgi:hypothetical protein
VAASTFVPHSAKQDRALFGYEEERKRITVVASGIQWGKTTVGSVWLKMGMLQHRERDDNFIVTSPSFRILAQSTLPPLLRQLDGLGRFNRQDMCFEMHDGGTLWFRTGTDPDSVVGITNVRRILCDEAGLYSLYFWENIQGRAAFKEAPILCVTSPYSQNWLYKDIVRHAEKDPNWDPDYLVIQARSDENPHFPKAEYERQRRKMDSRRFKMMFGGEFGQMEGLVYDCFSETENIVAPQSLPAGTVFYAGVDWGTTHAFVIHVRAVTPEGLHFQVGEYYRAGLNPMDMVQAAQTLKLSWGIKTFYCDPSQPGMIDLFNKHRLTAVGAENDIKIGIGYHYELLKTRRLKIFAGAAPYSVDQYSTYHYPSPKDRAPDQDAKEIKPVKDLDDAMDAARYVTIMTYRVSEGGKKAARTTDGERPDLRGMDHARRIEYLKRKPRVAYGGD